MTQDDGNPFMTTIQLLAMPPNAISIRTITKFHHYE